MALYANTTSKYYSNNFTSLSDGSHNFKAYTQDVAGNVNFTELRTVTVGPISVSGCTVLNVSGVYAQSGNIVPSDASVPCVNITASNVEFNGAGYSISNYTFNNTGIWAYNLNNVTIKNANVTTNTTVRNRGSIEFDKVNNSLIFNNTFAGIRGIVLTQSEVVNVSSNNVSTGFNSLSTNYGIYLLTNTLNASIIGNTISTSGSSTQNYGVYLNSVQNNTVSYNNISTNGANSNTGIRIGGSNNVVISNNIATNGTTNNWGIYTDANNNTINSNTIYIVGTSTGNHGIYLSTASNNTVTSNVLATSGTSSNYGIYILTGTNNTLTQNNISTTGSAGSNYGLYLKTNSSNNTISSNIINTNGTGSNYGVLLEAFAMNNIITLNNITANGTTNSNIGVYLLVNSSSNTISSNIIKTGGTTTNYGISILGLSNNNTVFSNIINTSGTTSGNNGAVIQGSSDNNITLNNIFASGLTTSNLGVYLGVQGANLTERNILSSNTIGTSGTSSNAGIRVDTASNNTMTLNNISTTGSAGSNYGVYLNTNSSNNTVSSNTINTNGTTANYGVYLLTNPMNNLFYSNTIRTAGTSTQNYGIYLDNSRSNNFTSNDITTNGTNFNYGILFLTNSSSNTVTSNTVRTGGTGSNYGLDISTNSNNNTIVSNIINTSGTSSDNYGVYVYTSSGNNVTLNNISASGATLRNYGIYLRALIDDNSSNDNTISLNNIRTDGTSNNYGVYLYTWIRNNNIFSNTIITNGTSNGNYGVYLYTSANNTISSNNISTYGTSSNIGIYLYTIGSNLSSNNTISSNIIRTDGTSTQNYGVYLDSSPSNNFTSNDIGTDGSNTNYGVYALSSSNNNLFNLNNISATLGTASHGIYVVNSSSNAFTDLIVTNATGRGIFIDKNSTANNFTNVVLNNSGTGAVFIETFGGSESYDNSFNNVTILNMNRAFLDLVINTTSGVVANRTSLIDTYVANYSFLGIGGVGLIAGSSLYGNIRFLNPVNGSGTNLSADVYVLNNSVTTVTNSTYNPGFNQSANVTLYGLATSGMVSILRNGVACDSTICTALTGLNAGTVVFNVTSWSNYSIGSDNTFPLVTIIRPENIIYNLSTVEFNITADENSTANFTLTNGLVNYTMTVNSSGTGFNATNSSVADGQYTARFFVWDIAGNLNSTTNVTFSVDTVLPVINFTNPTPANGSMQTGSSIFVNVSASDSNNISSFIDFDNSLVSWWRMDDLNSTGGVVDYMGRNNGTIQGGAVQNSSGKMGKSFSFDGAGDYISTGSDLIGIGDDSVCAWTYPRNWTGSNGLTIVNNGKSLFAILGANRLYWYSAFSASGLYTNPNTINLDTWQHVCAERNSSGYARLYINGVLKSSGDSGTPLAGTTNVTISVIGANGGFNGSIDDVMIFNRSLSANEIYALYANTTSKYYSNNFTNLADGAHTFKAYAQDLAGNVNFTEMRTVSVDTTAPTLNITYPLNNTYSNYVTDLNYTVSDSGLQACWYTLNSGTTNTTVTCGVNVTGLNSSLGTNIWFVYANDTSGNIGSSNITFTVTGGGDTTVPVVTVIRPENIVYNLSIIQFNITTDENSTANYSLDNGLVNYTMTVNATGTRFNATNSSVADGSYTARFFVWDIAGNLNSTANVTFSVDTVLPVINFTSPTPANGSMQTGSSIFVNVSASDTNNISSFIDFDNSLVSWWRMDDFSSSTVFDYMGRNNGTVAGNVTQNNSGYFGKSFSFDGVNGYVSAGNGVSLNYTSAVTLSAWIKTSQSSSYAGIISTQYSSPYKGYALTINNGNVSVNVDSGWQNCNNINNSQWHHISVSHNSSSSLVYIDGLLACSYSGKTNYGISSNLRIGRHSTTFNGSIDDVMIFNRSLSANEVLALYANSSSRYYGNNFTNLANGNHAFKAYSQDTAGNVNSTEMRTVSVDASAPYFTGVPAGGSLVYGNYWSGVTFNATDAVGFGTFVVNNSLFVINSTGFINTTSLLGAGAYYLNITINDSSNNVNSTIYTLTVNQANSSVNLTLNTTMQNISIVQRDFVLLNGTLVSGDSSGRLILYNNGTLINNMTTEVSNNTQFNYTGSYNITLIYFSSQNYSSSSLTWFVNVSALYDGDGDSVVDIDDKLFGNESNVSVSGITNLNITVAGNSTNGTYTGKQRVLIMDGSTLIANFSHNFSSKALDLINLSLQKGSNYIIFNYSSGLQENKTLYFEDSSYTSLCVKDSVVNSISEVSSGCNGASEFSFTSCIGSSLTSNGIACTDEGSRFRFDNLNHSAVRGTVAESSSSSSSGGGSSGGGGGGSSGVSTGASSFNLDKQDFNIKIVSGDSQTNEIIIENNGTSALSIKPIVKGIERYVSFDNDLITVAPGQSSSIRFTINAPEPGVYAGKIVIGSKEVIIMLNVASDGVLFDTIITVPEAYRVLTSNEKLPVLIELIEVGDEVGVDVTMSYVIKDFEGNTYYTESETFYVSGAKSYTKQFSTKDLKPGDYVLGTELVYIGGFATATAHFKIYDSAFNVQTWVSIIALFVSLIIAFITFMFFRKHSKQKQFKLKSRSY